jgi:hypothetical protein
MQKDRVIAQAFFPAFRNPNYVSDDNAHSQTDDHIIKVKQIGKQSSPLNRRKDMINIE